MKIAVDRTGAVIRPDSTRVIAKFFMNGDERAIGLIKNVMEMDEDEVEDMLTMTLREFSRRHRNITRVFERHFERVQHLLPAAGLKAEDIPISKKLLMGSYFTHEYSIESAAFFNPSMIEDPDQTGLVEGEKRVIVSFRATGEGHISSLVFRRGVLSPKGELNLQPMGRYIDEADVVNRHIYNKKMFRQKLKELKLSDELCDEVTKPLPDEFLYRDIRNRLREILDNPNTKEDMRKNAEKVFWVADAHYEIRFSLDTDIAARVIFPVSETESKGIEDARFVQFTDGNGEQAYYATYTAFDGHRILPKLMETRDFYHFRVLPMHGEGAMNKNLALFPRTIKGKYAMLSRIDGMNNYIMLSDQIHIWEKPLKIQSPRYPWELVQIGNCGSPIETDQGWLLITHGVGPMRKYCLGASLLDLNDPTKEIARMKEPLIVPNEEEREGYVPNVVYSCGSLVHNGELIIPYAMSDYASTYAKVNLEKLIERVLLNGKAR